MKYPVKRRKGHKPIRTCVSCGARRSKRELIRLIVGAQGFVIRDDHCEGQGRGVYICPSRSCWEELKRGDRLKRSFRRQGPIALHPNLKAE